MTARAKVAVIAGLTATLWLLVILAWHNPATALLVGCTAVILWACLAGETKVTAERQAELDRSRVH